MCDIETLEVVKWAVDLADRYNIGVTGVISSFIDARKVLESDEAAKAFVENETKEMKRSRAWL